MPAGAARQASRLSLLISDISGSESF